MPDLIYQDDAVVAFWRPGATDYLLVTFGDAIDVVAGDRFFADAPVAKADITCIGIMARQPNWYPIPSMQRLREAILPRLQAATARVGYGGSMGGYAAIKHSARLGLTHSLALCPQWSIDAAECDGRDPGFQHWFAPAMAGHHIRPEEVDGEVVLLLDPRDPVDAFHAERLRGVAPSAHTVPVYNVGHHVTRAFAGTANLTAMIAAVLDRDFGRLARLAARLRRGNPERAHTVLRAAASTHPKLAARALHHPLSIRHNAVGDPADYLLPLLPELLERGATAEAGLVMAAIADRHAVALEAAELLLLDNARRRRRAPWLESFHRSVVCYEITQGRLRHLGADEIAARGDAVLPVSIEIAGRRAELSVTLDGIRFRLDVLPDGLCRPIATPPPAAFPGGGSWTVEPDPTGDGDASRIALRGASGYLCAGFATRVSADRQAVDDWERFRIVPAAS